jgi:hypothetical protein
MQQVIKIITLFDITETGVVKTSKNSDDKELELRRKQSNFETILQVISLRSQPLNVSKPIVNKGQWTFEFTNEATMIFATSDDPIGLLKEDLHNVPMITGLSEKGKLEPYIIVAGDNQNIWFETDV